MPMETQKKQSFQLSNIKETIQSEGWKSTILQFIKFGLVGVSNTLISLAVYYVCVNAFHMHHQLANLLGFLIGVVNSYFWNSRYVFKAGERRTLKEHLATFARTVAGYGVTSYLLGAALLYLWVDVLHISENLAPIINLFFTVPLNFLVNKFWAFRKAPAPENGGKPEARE